jgi:hypothetical protein
MVGLCRLELQTSSGRISVWEWTQFDAKISLSLI